MPIVSLLVKATVVACVSAISIYLNSLSPSSVEITLKFALAASYGVLAYATNSHSRAMEELAARMLNMTYLFLSLLSFAVLTTPHFH